jgi:hypothetical protein
MYYLLTWGALEEISKDFGEIVADEFVSGRNLDKVTLILWDDVNDDGTHESDVVVPVRVLRDHTSRVFPCTCVHLILDTLWKIAILQVIRNLSWVVYRYATESEVVPRNLLLEIDIHHFSSTAGTEAMLRRLEVELGRLVRLYV